MKFLLFGWCAHTPPTDKCLQSRRLSKAQESWGFKRPVRFEVEINNLEIVEEISTEISGTFYRVMPEAQFPAFIPKDLVCSTERVSHTNYDIRL